MWTTDFLKHCKILDQFQACMSSQPDELEESLDLIFKWTSLTMLQSTNMKFIVNFLDFCTNLVNFLIEREYSLWEFEIQVLMPILTDKAGHNNTTIQQKAKKIIVMSFDICDKQRVHNALISALGNKNLKVKAECLDVLATFIS